MSAQHTPKYDAIQGVSGEELDAYCKTACMRVVAVRAIGRTYFEATITKAIAAATGGKS